MISNRSHGMRKYKSTDSHYLELATRSFNFRSLTENTENTKGSIQQLSSSQLLLNALPKILQVKDKHHTIQLNDSLFCRLPDDIFISKEQQISSSSLSLSSSLPSNIPLTSFFGAINAFKDVSYTQTDRSKTILHCFLEDSQPRSSESPLSWQQVSQELLGTSLDDLGQVIKQYYSPNLKSEDSNTEQPQTALPSISKSNLSLIENQLFSTIPQVIFRRIPSNINSSSIILSSVHMNKAFLQIFGITIDEFLVEAALQRSLPDLQLNSGYQQLIIQSLHAMHRKQPTSEQYSNNQCEFLHRYNNQIIKCNYSFECQDLHNQSQQLLRLRILSLAPVEGSSLNEQSSNIQLNCKRQAMNIPNKKQQSQKFGDDFSRSIFAKAFDIELKNNIVEPIIIQNSQQPNRLNHPNNITNYYGEIPRKIRFSTSDSSTLSC